MKNMLDSFFSIVECAVHGKSTDEIENLNEDEQNALFEMAVRSGMTALLYPAAAQALKSDELREKWQKMARNGIMRQMEMTRAAYIISSESKKRGISAVFFKGAVLADLYPHYSQRRSSDIDILVTDEEQAGAIQMLKDIGYEHKTKSSEEHVQLFIMQNSGYAIELHTRLWEDYEGQQINVLEAFKLTAPEKLISLNVCGFDITTLEPGGHLTYQMYHIIKHFILNGIGMRYLIDVTLFIEKYKEQINFKTFWNNMDKLDYSQFCKHFFTLCGLYVGLDTEFFTSEELVLDENAQNLMIDIMSRRTANEQKQIMAYMTPYLVGEKTMRKTALGRKLDTIFLRPKDLQGKFVYAKKYKFLLPIAWIHRIIDFIVKSRRRPEAHHTVSEKMNAAEQRLNLLNKLGLVDGKK
jgi:hypothetical protein